MNIVELQLADRPATFRRNQREYEEDKRHYTYDKEWGEVTPSETRKIAFVNGNYEIRNSPWFLNETIVRSNTGQDWFVYGTYDEVVEKFKQAFSYA